MEKYLYISINFLTILVPFIRSFEPRVAYYKQFKALFSAIFCTGSFFIVWDILFTSWGVWGFNERYLSGFYMANLPLGECLFFLTVPYACIFIYEVLIYFVNEKYLVKKTTLINFLILLTLAFVAITNYDKIYPFTTAILAIGFLAIHSFFITKQKLAYFYLAFLVSLVPFLLVNGVLTGSGIEEQIVWYNDNENLGIRLGTIPLDDFIYCYLLLFMNVSFYEFFKQKFKTKT
ncbi:MAG: lycopene cyclase domain-containing protein [Chitinophagales bacterium]